MEQELSTTIDIERALEEALADGDIQMDAGGFVRLLRDALRTVRGTRVGADPAGQLTQAEVAELRRGGLAPTADHAAYERVRARTAAEMAALLSRALSTTDAATRMGVDPSRVRQLLAERRLLAARDGGEWRILDLQFTSDGLVPNIGPVVAALPEGMPPLAAAIWLRTPEPDLEVAGEPVSPIEWLTAGGDPERLRPLAADL
jgi:excisionase family DNA binding protein